MKKPKIRPETRERAARSFLIALRSNGVNDAVARVLARQAADIYVARMAKGRTKDASYILSTERAKELADELNRGLM